MDFRNFEAWLEAWFRREAGFGGVASFELAKQLTRDMDRAGIEVDYFALYERSHPEPRTRVMESGWVGRRK